MQETSKHLCTIALCIIDIIAEHESYQTTWHIKLQKNI